MSHTKPEGRLLCGDIEAPVGLLSVESNVYVIWENKVWEEIDHTFFSGGKERLMFYILILQNIFYSILHMYLCVTLEKNRSKWFLKWGSLEGKKEDWGEETRK